MDKKIETPEEFFDSLIVCGSIQDRNNLITARDAAIRADERQKAAGWAVEYYEKPIRESEPRGLSFPPFQEEMQGLRAAILAEPEEAQG